MCTVFWIEPSLGPHDSRNRDEEREEDVSDDNERDDDERDETMTSWIERV